MSNPPTTIRELLRQELPRLYAFGFFMCCDREEAKEQLRQLAQDATTHGEGTLLGTENPRDELLGLFARGLEDRLGRKADFTFEGLDEILRSDITRPIDLDGGPFGRDPKRLNGMLWQLKRKCLVATLGCLPPGVRISFVLTDLLGYGPNEAAALLEIKESAYRVRLTRARKRIEDYLAPRCYHVDRQNPCTCNGRLVIALDAKFVTPPPHDLDTPNQAHDSEGPQRDVGSLYQGLPQVRLTETDILDVLTAVGS